jgi:exosome complex exonuclease DIS3/RRP44
MSKITGRFIVNRVNYYKEIDAYILSSDNEYKITNFDSLIAKPTHNDIVEYDVETGKVTKVIERSKISLCGVLHLSSNVIMNVNKKGVPQKMFTPYNRLYPPMLVASKKSTDQYIVARLANWIDKYPVASCDTIIGDVGDEETEYQYLLYKHDVKWKKFNGHCKNELKGLSTEIDASISIGDRIDLRELNICSIDPKGCVDIDDAIHYRRLEGKHEIGVHIADVTYYIKPGTYIDKEIRNRGFSIYLPHKRLDMITEKLAIEYCSLRQGKDKYAVSVIITFDDSGNILNHTFHKSVINNKRAMSYEDANGLIKHNTSDLKQIFDICKKVSESKKESSLALLFGHDKGVYDSHNMIETLMVLANSLVAKEIKMKFPDTAILRSHRGLIGPVMDNKEAEETAMYINRRSVSRATYIFGSNKDTFHEGLQEEFYTHFTSPIRRYIDIVVHRMLFNVNTIDQELCESINDIQKRHSRVELSSKRLKLMYDLVKEGITHYEADGHVIGIDRNRVQVYLPKYKIELDVAVFSKELDKILEYDMTENKMQVEYEGDNFEINVMDCVKVKVIILLKDTRNKFKAQLIEPNPLLLIKK